MSTHPMPIQPSPGVQPPGPNRFKPIDPVRVLRQHIKLLSVVAVVGLVLGVGLWFGLRTYMPTYASSAQLRVSDGVANVDQMSTGGISSAPVAAMESFIQSEVYKIQSEAILTKALNDQAVRNSEWAQTYKTNEGWDIFKAREDLVDDHLRVSMIRNTQLIKVSVATPQREDCQKIADAIVKVYLSRIEADTNNQVSSRRNSLTTEQNAIRGRINNLTKDIEEYSREYGLTNLDNRLDEAAIDMQKRLDVRSERQFELDDYQKRYEAALEKQAAGGGPSATATAGAAENEAIQLRDERLRSLREQREVSLYDFGPGHRILLAIDRQIAATEAERERELERLIRENEQAMLSGLKQEIENITELITDYDDQILLLQEKLVDLNVHQNSINNKQRQLQEEKDARVRIENNLSEVRMIQTMDEARPVQRQSAPSLPELVFPDYKVVIPLTAMMTVGLVGVFIFLRELVDQSIKSPADIKLLKDAELLGILPHADEDPSGPSSVERVVEKYPSGLLAEAFRQVRTAVLGKMDRRGYKTLLIASAQPDAGTSSVTHNLATSLAFNGRKVAIVDANFRRPSQHTFVDADNDRGIVDILLYGASLDDMLITVHDPDLAVLPTGRAGDAQPELLECTRFRSLIGELEAKFDIVLIDAPPALLSSECQVLTKQVDAVIAVVRAGSDKRGMIDRMAGQFAGHRADMLGIVLNGVQSSVGGYFRASFRDFYRYREDGVAANGRGRRRADEITETAGIE